jgi:hypothetical protein
LGLELEPLQKSQIVLNESRNREYIRRTQFADCIGNNAATVWLHPSQPCLACPRAIITFWSLALELNPYHPQLKSFIEGCDLHAQKKIRAV